MFIQISFSTQHTIWLTPSHLSNLSKTGMAFSNRLSTAKLILPTKPGSIKSFIITTTLTFHEMDIFLEIYSS